MYTTSALWCIVKSLRKDRDIASFPSGLRRRSPESIALLGWPLSFGIGSVLQKLTRPPPRNSMAVTLDSGATCLPRCATGPFPPLTPALQMGLLASRTVAATEPKSALVVLAPNHHLASRRMRGLSSADRLDMAGGSPQWTFDPKLRRRTRTSSPH